MTLEDMIRQLAERGELTHLSLAARDGVFYANYAPASTSGYARTSDADPVEALKSALKEAPVRFKTPRHRDTPEVDAAPEPEVTAAVSPPRAPVDGFSDWSRP